MEELQQKGVSGGFYFDYTMLDAYGCREEVEQMMRRPYWERLFNWREDTYEPVVHEFVATFEPVPSSHDCTPCMKFNLFGRGYQLSLIQLGERLGLYTHEETMSEEWLNLPRDFESDAAVEAYWSRITDGRGGRFTGIKQSTSKITIPSLKMMKLLLNLTFGGRTKNLHKVYRFDLFHLWSLEMNEPIQMAHMVLQMFHSQKNAKCPYVWIGPVVTRLCHGLGLQGELAREKVIATMQPFNDAHLSRSYVRRMGDMPRPPREEPRQEPVVEGGRMRMDLQHEEMMRHNEAIMRHNEAILRQNEAIERQREAYARQEERQQQQVDAIEQLRLWMEHRFPPLHRVGTGFRGGNISTSPLSSVFGSPPPSPKGIPRTEMMVPRHTLERGESSGGNHDDSSSEEGEGYGMEFANRGLMLQVEDLFRFNNTMEETRESELLDTIRRLEHRVDVLELEVRRIILDRQGEEPFELEKVYCTPLIMLV
nr:hypothetical protein GOBAR_AA21571 [Ipomoea trifida]